MVVLQWGGHLDLFGCVGKIHDGHKLCHPCDHFAGKAPGNVEKIVLAGFAAEDILP